MNDMMIQTINSVEVSSICDNSCPYCPCSRQREERPVAVGLMPWEVFERTIDWVLYFARRGSQRELNLFGVGEPTLHPRLAEMVSYARRMLPFKQVLHLNTNGNRMTEELARELKAAGIDKIDITGHDHHSTAKTLRIFRKVGIPHSVSYDFALYPNNWAEQVDWFEPEYAAGLCPWISKGQVMVMSSGHVTTCCIDAFGQNIIGTVFDAVSEFSIEESPLCSSCHHDVAAAEERRIRLVR